MCLLAFVGNKIITVSKRLITKEVTVGNIKIGGNNPVRIQTMTTTDTMDTIATVEQSIRCIEAGAELVRITAPSKKEAENLLHIKNELRSRGYDTPLVADIHFTPNAAEIAARIVEKVRVNPGNYVDKKKFEQIEYTDAEYAEEIERIRERFTPLVLICKEHGTAMRIGTNHGSLSDRIMSRYGDTAIGMVESAMEFLRIARSLDYHNIVLSMKSSNPIVMVEAYRLLVSTMDTEFGEIYPLHLGVTEAGDGIDGRIKSAIGIGTLLEEGIGDTIRVSLTEDPEFELPVCKQIINHIQHLKTNEFIDNNKEIVSKISSAEFPSFGGVRGGFNVPVVIADYSKCKNITPKHLEEIGYKYDEQTDKWNIADDAADYIFTNNQVLGFDLPGTLKVLLFSDTWLEIKENPSYIPLFDAPQYIAETLVKSASQNFIMIDYSWDDYHTEVGNKLFDVLREDTTAIICISSPHQNALQELKKMFADFQQKNIHNPVVIICDTKAATTDEAVIHYAIETGGLFLDGLGNGICFGYHYNNPDVENPTSLMNYVAFGILQATRKRISKTEYISCPSCGRTLFDLQETTAKIRARTNHLKGVKIAIMGCIVNGPGEMADADFGYVGSGVGKITLYKSKEVVKKNIDSEVAVDELINLLKENEAWVEPAE